ncbi:hypothetical protein A3C86_00615 [Candidatus Kaiserbacteria bacterium RIFCSPHIGHO2_02_FULL_49_16]|uniref:Type II secretion system protein GspI C-terminal domain-containing protein n=1 Tax=Candidatus Kaiserbacteria bacterium RIFCSPHIGHO2_02_FULL_49_16 TaxID=1798490 RepID=A0A1F6DDF1_9BACT|nr:MAG: hypothetical protein A3C86_00615 [Candidatus Kaiserbacteria bacterium RIFCSPHIGHO2_02_FULL_49_16]
MEYKIQKNTNSHSRHTPYAIRHTRGFTLVETMVAISLLTIAVVAPMSLTTQSLGSAFYARDQITAFHLAQEAIESVRHVRDGNVLKIALGYSSVDLLGSIPNDQDFTVDTTNDDQMDPCAGACPVIRKSSQGLYGYNSAWTPTQFTRAVRATFVPDSGNDEIKLTVTVSWKTGNYQTRSIAISANLYRWVNDSSAAQ